MAASTAVAWEDTPQRDSPEARTAQIASLTGLRGFAALMVVLIHVAGMTDFKWLGLPDYGPVSLFVLSGYLLYRPWSKWGIRVAERPRIGTFAKRRLVRIFPAYLAVVLLLVLVYPPARPDGVDRWVQALTLTGIYVPGGLMPELFQTWSLGTELSWYLALPFMAALTGVLARSLPVRSGFWLTVGLIALSVPVSGLWRWWVESEDLGKYFTYGFWLPGYLFCFGAGAVVAHLVEGHRAGLVPLRRLRGWATDPWTLLVFALAVVLVGTSSMGGPAGWEYTTFAQHQVRIVAATLVAVTLLVIAVLGAPSAPLNRVLGTQWFNAIGRWSYGLYLWHLPVIYVLADYGQLPSGVAGLAAWLAIVLGVSLPLSAATYRWVERPTIAWSRGHGLRGRPPVPAGRHASGSASDRRDDRPRTASRTTASSATAPRPAPDRSRTPGE